MPFLRWRAVLLHRPDAMRSLRDSFLTSDMAAIAFFQTAKGHHDDNWQGYLA
jgi:hypothetical protein